MGRRLRRRLPHSAKPNEARRASVKALLVRTAAFVGEWDIVRGLKAAACEREQQAKSERLMRKLGVRRLAPSSAFAAAFSMPDFPKSPVKRRNPHFHKSATCRSAHFVEPRLPRGAPPHPYGGGAAWGGGFAAASLIQQSRMRRAAQLPL